MKPIIDESRCIGCGLCAQISPDLFVIESTMIAKVIGDASDDDLKERLEAILEYCPVNAISIAEA
ncbi:MAG: ferredoxin [Eubacteriales bacterium]|nr:ferredoxin [Eubacteriales bacterium]